MLLFILVFSCHVQSYLCPDGNGIWYRECIVSVQI
jgi:hypothetical protein